MDFNYEDDEQYECNVRKLPKRLIDELKTIDDHIRPNHEFNLPLYIRASLQVYIEQYHKIRRVIQIEPIDDEGE